MNSNKIAVAVLILACIVIVSSLIAASVTEPIFPETAESETDLIVDAQTSTDDAVSQKPVTESQPREDASEPSEDLIEEPSEAPSKEPSEDSVEISDEQPDEESPEVSEEEPDEQPDEDSEEVSAEEPEVSEPEESSEDEPIREPLGKPDLHYHLTVIVKDIEGFTIEGAEVHIDDTVGETDEFGVYTIELNDKDFVLNVKSGAFVSYYEEVTLYEKNSVIEISLARADKIRRLLNSATLRPYVSDHAELDAAITALFDELFEPGMDTYDKVKACYDWLIENTEYKRPYHLYYDDWQCAYQTIADGIGTCNCYSRAFAAMMRYIGLECYVVEGTTSANGGGYTGHEWTTIKIDGEFYIFDPQVEDALAGRNGGKVNYARFCLPEPHAKYRYSVCSRDFFVNKFGGYVEENGHFTEE